MTGRGKQITISIINAMKLPMSQKYEGDTSVTKSKGKKRAFIIGLQFLFFVTKLVLHCETNRAEIFLVSPRHQAKLSQNLTCREEYIKIMLKVGRVYRRLCHRAILSNVTIIMQSSEMTLFCSFGLPGRVIGSILDLGKLGVSDFLLPGQIQKLWETLLACLQHSCWRSIYFDPRSRSRSQIFF